MAEMFGRYQLLTRIGEGGMAEVFRARLEAPGGAEKILVIKRIRPSLHEEPAFLRRFVEEARIALPLSHANITTVFEFGEVEGQYFLAMEYVHGQNLGAVLAQARSGGERLPPALALYVASQVAKGLAYAHGALSPEGEAAGVVHLDVSPQNILLSYDGAVKLTDFGIAKVRGDLEGGKPEQLLGKASYLAPEQIRRQPVDGRTDVYALGCVLHECLVGEPPHGRGGDREILARVVEAEAPRLSSRDPSLAPFDALLARALAKDPDRRYSSAADFQLALARALYELSPGTDAPQLATWMRGAFADELRPSGELAERRARILAQLREQGFHADTDETVEIPDTTAVALPGPPEAPKVERRRRWRRGLVAAAGLALVLALAGGAAFFLGIERGPFAALRPPLNPAQAAPPPPTASASLSLHSWPNATVEIDGVLQSGRTPILDLEIPAGEHRVRFSHPTLEIHREVEIHLAPGESRSVVVTLGR